MEIHTGSFMGAHLSWQQLQLVICCLGRPGKDLTRCDLSLGTSVAFGKVWFSSPCCSFLRSVAVWNPEVVSSPSHSLSLSSGNASTLAAATDGRSNSTVTAKAWSTSCLWWPKGRRSAQRMQSWKESCWRTLNSLLPTLPPYKMKKMKTSCRTSTYKVTQTRKVISGITYFQVSLTGTVTPEPWTFLHMN